MLSYDKGGRQLTIYSLYKAMSYAYTRLLYGTATAIQCEASVMKRTVRVYTEYVFFASDTLVYVYG